MVFRSLQSCTGGFPSVFSEVVRPSFGLLVVPVLLGKVSDLWLLSFSILYWLLVCWVLLVWWSVMAVPVVEPGNSRERGLSFAAVVGGRAPDDDLPVRELSIKNGCPVIILSIVEIARLSALYKTALIFKFFAQHIPNSELQKGLSNWGVHGGLIFQV